MDVEVYKKVAKFKIFRINNLNGGYSDFLTIDEVLLEIKSKKDYWYSIDGDYEADYKYSEILDELYTNIKSVKEELSDYIDGSIDETNYIYQFNIRLSNKYWSKIVYQNTISRFNEYIQINYNSIKLYEENDGLFPKIREGYIYCLAHNYNKEVFTNFVRLYADERISSYTSYDNNSEKNKALMLYLSIETKNFPQANIIECMDSEITSFKSRILDLQDEITNLKVDLSSYNKEYKQELDEWKKEKEQWYEEKETEFKLLVNSFNERTEELENQYAEKLKLDEPCKFWDKKSKECKNAFVIWMVITAIVISVILLGSYFLMTKLYAVAANVSKLKDVFPVSFVTIAIITFMIYILRTCTKIMLSNKHLETEYKQKSMFTYFYLSLLGDDKTSKEITESEKNLIYSNLFSNPDTGLVKGTQDNADIGTLMNILKINKG